MRTRTVIFCLLIGLNAALAFPLVGRVWHPAVADAAPRAWADYLTVPGNIAGGPDQVVLVVDMTHDELGAMSYDDTTRRLQVMSPIDLGSIFRAADGMPPSALRPPGNAFGPANPAGAAAPAPPVQPAAPGLPSPAPR